MQILTRSRSVQKFELKLNSMLSNTSRYAIRAMIYLAAKSDSTKKIGIKQIAQDLDIPSPFLGKILQQLAKHKILDSTKGPNGGFSFPKNGDKITLFQIVEIIDGDDLFKKCLISLRSCQNEGIPCPLHNQYESIRNEINNLFQNQTIISLAEEIKASGGKIEI